LTAYYET